MKNNWIQTYSGKKFYPMDPKPEHIDIEDIAHALSNICRYTGHCMDFYSVAQHSWIASFHVPSEDSLAALLHDATEAYLADVARPVKALLPNYKEIEDGLYRVIAEKFGLPPVIPPSVKEVDLRLLATERRDVMTHHLEWDVIDKDERVKPLDWGIVPWNPIHARGRFLDRYFNLTRRS